MGVYTYADNPMGLSMSPRLEEILAKYHADEPLPKEDIEFLIDESARYYTLRKHVKSDKFKVKSFMMEEEYEIKEVLGDLLTELDYVNAHKINKNKIYFHELSHFNPYFDNNIEKMRPNRVESEVRNAVKEINELQKSFDDNNDNLTVRANFKHLDKKYKYKKTLTVESDYKEVTQDILQTVVSYIEDEVKGKQNALSNLKG